MRQSNGKRIFQEWFIRASIFSFLDVFVSKLTMLFFSNFCPTFLKRPSNFTEISLRFSLKFSLNFLWFSCNTICLSTHFWAIRFKICIFEFVGVWSPLHAKLQNSRLFKRTNEKVCKNNSAPHFRLTKHQECRLFLYFLFFFSDPYPLTCLYQRSPSSPSTLPYTYLSLSRFSFYLSFLLYGTICKLVTKLVYVGNPQPPVHKNRSNLPSECLLLCTGFRSNFHKLFSFYFLFAFSSMDNFFLSSFLL